MPKLSLKLKKETPRKSILKTIGKKKDLQFISSGNPLLNLILTGRIKDGYPFGRFINIKGEYSSSKTLAVIEVCNELYYNFHKKQGKSIAIKYNDAEEAFDKDYGERLGMPINKIEWAESETVEDWHYDLWDFINKHKDKDNIIYILDSLDAVSDKREKEDIKKNLAKMAKKKAKEEEIEETGKEAPDEKDEKDAGGFGAQKAKFISKLLRDLKTQIKKTNCLLIIVSQLRDDLKARYGSKDSRSGGRALGFYATQIVDLSKRSPLYKTTKAKELDMPYGRVVEAFIDKNKVYSEGRCCKYNIIFNHGYENITTCLDFLVEHKKITYSKASYKWHDLSLNREKVINYFTDNKKEYEELLELVEETWNEIEESCSFHIKSKWE